MTAGQSAGAVQVAPAAEESLVVCTSVSRTFGRGPLAVPAVRDVSVTVSPGMLVALTGPSGSGKSTLLHLMAGLETPSSGSVTWPGLGGSPTGRAGVVGLVFQGPSLVPALDVLENVTLPLLLAGVDGADAVRRAGAALERLNVHGLAAKLPEEISGGQAQRVAVARVLASRPQLILADEPTGQLDHETGAHVIEVLLQTAVELNAALVVTTHDPVVAERFPDQWRMADGRLVDGDRTC
ncbi:MAG TPA: ABC transporter ATP-binding protein [Blastococcus sp.]|jgi:putative ABC transport system ATP-binding protein|nr:ABC transporter ATP-binding protein [Blastococcus sp.]